MEDKPKRPYEWLVENKYISELFVNTRTAVIGDF